MVSLPADHPARLLHELQVHQIELELQNEELQSAKAAVEAALEQYTELYEFAPVGYFTLTADGTIRLVNLTGATLVGLERSRLVGHSFRSLVLPEQRLAFAAFLTRAFTSPLKQTHAFDLAAKGQPQRPVHVEAQCLPPSSRSCRLLVIDLTDRHRAETQMRVSEVRYRRLFEAAHDGVLLLDPATCLITDANPFMSTLLGYSRAELVGRQLFEIGLLKDASASRAMFQKLKRRHEVRYENLPLETRAGRHQEVEVVANLYQEDGHAVIQCNIRDITKRKLTEEILRQSEALFSALIAHSPLGVYVVDACLQLQQINPRGQQVFAGMDPLVGRDFSEIVHLVWPARVAAAIVARFRHTLTTGRSYVAPRFAERRLDVGRREVYEWQIQRVTLPTGEFGVVCFFNNITARVRAERAQLRLDVVTASHAKLQREVARRRRTETALRRSERQARALIVQSQQLQEELRHVSHQSLRLLEAQRKAISRELHDEISQLLIGINVRLSIFTQAASLDPGGIRRSVQPLRRLVGTAVRVVHRFARALRPAMLDDLGLIPALRSYIEALPKRKGRAVVFAAEPGVERLGNDQKTILYRVAQESLTNVAKHARATQVTISLCTTRQGVRLEVADNGQAFDVVRLSSAKGTHRLGLIGMRERVEMVGGRFHITSQPGSGTTVRADVPFGPKRRR